MLVAMNLGPGEVRQLWVERESSRAQIYHQPQVFSGPRSFEVVAASGSGCIPEKVVLGPGNKWT